MYNLGKVNGLDNGTVINMGTTDKTTENFCFAYRTHYVPVQMFTRVEIATSAPVITESARRGFL